MGLAIPPRHRLHAKRNVLAADDDEPALLAETIEISAPDVLGHIERLHRRREVRIGRVREALVGETAALRFDFVARVL